MEGRRVEDRNTTTRDERRECHASDDGLPSRTCQVRSTHDQEVILQGLIPIVDMPPLRPRPGDARKQALRRVLVDRADLDAFVESRKRPR